MMVNKGDWDMKEIPALYEVAKKITHDAGLPWTDPRTLQTYPPPKKPATERKDGPSGENGPLQQGRQKAGR
jgi:hypothetical protein